MVQLKFPNTHIKHKAQLAMLNMRLKGHHIGIYITKCNFERDLTWFLGHCFMFLYSD
jgi:hypothetical protein